MGCRGYGGAAPTEQAAAVALRRLEVTRTEVEFQLN